MQAKTFYNSDGKIITSVIGDLSIIDFSQWDGLDFIEQSANADEHWVSNNIILERLPNPATLLGFTINNIPCKGTLIIDKSKYEITKSCVELDLPAGKNIIKLDCFPYLPKLFEVEV